MSTDKIRPLMKAVADLPEIHAGFVLGIVNLLRGDDAADVRLAVGQALAPFRGKPKSSKVAKAVAVALLVLVGTISVASTTEKFVVKDNFVVNIEADAKVKISYLGKDFKSWFIDKIEEPIQGGELRYQKLQKISVDSQIINELGGEAKAETTLTEMFSVMRLQSSGGRGALLVNRYANVFYIRDVNNVLRAVFVRWLDDGWGVDTSSDRDLHAWGCGYLTFSRNNVTV